MSIPVPATAQPDDNRQSDSLSAAKLSPAVLSAHIGAVPYVGLTMLFVGSESQPAPTAEEEPVQEQQRKKLNVLLDTGSTHNFCSGHMITAAHVKTDSQFNVTVADGSQQCALPEYELSFQLQDCPVKTKFCMMSLPEGVDVILGNSWLAENQACLQIVQGQCSLISIVDQQPYILSRPSSLKSHPLNSAVMWTSAACCTSSADEMFLMYVHAAGSEGTSVDRATPAFSAAVQAIDSVAGMEAMFVEQQSAVQGIRELVQQFQSVFPVTVPAGLPPERDIAHAIPLQPNSQIPATKLRRLTWAQEQEMISQVKTLLAKGWIQPSTSPYGCPILFVKKKDGGMRMCVDYRAINKMTVKSAYPLPRIDDILDRLNGATVFSCLDLQQAYHQIRLKDADVQKTAFTTSLGLFEYRVLPFGLSNAPGTFQSLINAAIGPDLRDCCMVYMDDIIVFSKDPEQHLEHLRQVLHRLQKAKLYAKLSKCRFALSSVKFLGHIVSAAGINPDPGKTAIIRDWPTPTCVKDVRQFVGLAQYFRKFLQGFPTLAAPLTKLFRKYATWHWGSAEQAAFDGIKNALQSAPCLKLPDPAEHFTMVCDASGVGIGAVLLQQSRPVAFDGRKLTDTEGKWSATEQEMLAVVHHMEKWRCYLEGRHFTVVTDHQPNTWFSSQKVLTPRLTRWYEKIASYSFDWEYRPGRINVADPLSRSPAFTAMMTAVCTQKVLRATLTGMHCLLSTAMVADGTWPRPCTADCHAGRV